MSTGWRRTLTKLSTVLIPQIQADKAGNVKLFPIVSLKKHLAHYREIWYHVMESPLGDDVQA